MSISYPCVDRTWCRYGLGEDGPGDVCGGEPGAAGGGGAAAGTAEDLVKICLGADGLGATRILSGREAVPPPTDAVPSPPRRRGAAITGAATAVVGAGVGALDVAEAPKAVLLGALGGR